MDTLPKISIITVCYNAQDCLEKTIVSVINQKYENLEYIIIDGGSTDGTLSVIEKYLSYIDVFITEKDNGIFDAMNKGIKKCTGNWVNFMNAGDFLVNEQILAEIDFSKYKYVSLIYGKTITNGVIQRIFPVNSLHYGYIPACHQSMFFNKNILQDELYYTYEVELYNDYELVNRLYLKKHSFSIIPIVIANYASGGISSIISWKARKAKYQILFKYYGVTGLVKSLLERTRIINPLKK